MKVIVITGTTATGKTGKAFDLAQKNHAEIINCDSRQIYKYLDIVTGKDIGKKSKLNLRYSKNGFDIGYHTFSNCKIWLYDILSPKLPFSSFNYFTVADFLVRKFFESKKNIVIVGGTYLYLQSLLYGLQKQLFPPNPTIRRSLADETVASLQNKLKNISQKLFQSLNNSEKNNPQRLIRKIELAASGYNENLVTSNIIGQPFERYKQINFEFEYIGLRFKKRENLVSKVRRRVMERIAQGAIEEVKILKKEGFTRKDPGLKTIGYQQIYDFLDNNISEEKMKDVWVNKEIQYAKRQITFMKKDKNISWQDVD